MDSIELMPMLRNVLQSVGLDELKGIPGLRIDVHADNLIESGLMVAHRCPASPTEQIEEPNHQGLQ